MPEKQLSSMEMEPGLQGPFSLFFSSQFLAKEAPIPKDLDLAGQTAIITGGTGGLGLECARMLLAHGLTRVIITARNEAKGEQVCEALRKDFPKAVVWAWSLDLDTYESIRKFVERCATLDRIDVVILNAGLTAFRYQANPSTKHESQFQVNYLSTAYLALELLPIIKDKRPPEKPGRLTIVSSGMAYSAKFSEQQARSLFSAFDDPKLFNTDRYATTKLLELMFLFKLKEQASPDEVIINAVDPGLIGGASGATGLHRGLPAPLRAFFALLKLLTGRSPRSGATTYVTAAVVLGPESHGSFVYDWKISPFPTLMYGSKGNELIEQLWKETMSEVQAVNVRNNQ